MKVKIIGGVQTDFRKIITSAPVQFQRYVGLPKDSLIGQEFDLGTDEARKLLSQGVAEIVHPPAPPKPEPEPASEPKAEPETHHRRKGRK